MNICLRMYVDEYVDGCMRMNIYVAMYGKKCMNMHVDGCMCRVSWLSVCV